MITTIVNNYPKIPSLSGGPNIRRSMAQLDEGRITLDDLHQVQDEATKDAISEQVKAGVELVTDGQIRWDDGQTYIASKLNGFSISGLIRYFDSNTYYRQPVVDGKISWREPILVKDYLFARAASERPVKVALTGPYTLAALSEDTYYHDKRALVNALAAVLNQEAKALAEAGAEFIQFDEPSILKAPADFPIVKEAMSVLTAGVNAKLALYTYFGEAGELAQQLFSLPFQVFGLDFVMGPNNYAALKSFPGDKDLAMGIVDARNTKLETVDEIVAAVKKAKEHVSLDRLYLNPSCGLEFLPRRNAYDKLVRLTEGAKRALEVLV
ncbi:MAG: methylcobamide--CoM methyltransferase [Dehalococcoidia bacterium]|nr:methylcobamide--CoM methyltransferase [Dehalococcoidia bacterium]